MDIKPILTSGAGAGILATFLLPLIKTLFRNGIENLSKIERWVIFILCYGLCVFCLLKATATSDGGPQQGQKQNTEDISKKSGVNPPSASLAFAQHYAYIGNTPSDVSACGVDLKDYIIYESFNNDKPYFINPGNTTLRLVLVSLDEDNNKAQIEVNNNGNPITGTRKLLITFPNVNSSSIFQFETCKFRITYLGHTSFNAGFKYLFRTRHCAKVRLEIAQ